VQVLQLNDDLGTQDAPFLSVRTFRERIMPHYKRGLDWVDQTIQILCPGGGYVLAPVHNIQPGVPPENVIAMFDAALGKG
jgi:uroporphyrinogen-III decarboxylase